MSHAAMLANRLGALSVAIWSRLNADSAKALSPSAIAAVMTLRYWEPMSIKELSSVIGTSHSATVRLVENLVNQRLVKRLRGKSDQRVAVLALSKSGHRFIDKYSQKRANEFSSVVDCLTTNEQRSLERIVSKILSNLPESTTQPRLICRYCNHELCTGSQCPVGESWRKSLSRRD